MDIDVLLVLGLILVSTKIFSIITRRIHLPQVVGALLAGILLGPAVFNIIRPNDTISVFAEIGVILLLFSAGMETDLKKLRTSFKSSAIIAVLGISMSLVGGFAVAAFFGQALLQSFFIGVVIASTSVSITIEALQEMGKLKTNSGTAILGAAVLDDVIGIVMLAVVMSMGEGGLTVAGIGLTLLKIILFFLFSSVCGFGIYKLYEFLIAKFGYKRRLSIFGIAFCFIMAYLAELFGLADITGAYIAGVAFSQSRCEEHLETKTNVLSYMLFTPVFFANIGLMTSFDGLNGNIILFATLLLVAAVLTKGIGCGIGAKICSFKNNEAVQISTGMIARGEVSIIIASKGIVIGLMEANLFSSIICVVVITVLITPILLKVVYTNKQKESSS